MNWGILSGFFLLSTIKFMFTPIGGPPAGLTFFETYFSCVAGGCFGAAVFYYSGNFFINRAKKKLDILRAKHLAEGKPFQEKKKFTKMNRFVIRIKTRLGIIGTSFWVPFLLSVPIGTIITAKFFGHDKRTFPLIVLGMFINGMITTSLVYLFTL